MDGVSIMTDTSAPRTTRRNLLKAAVPVAVGLAGCSSGSDSSSPSSPPTTTSQPTRTGTHTPTPVPSPRNTPTGPTPRSAADRAEEFVARLDAGEFEAAHEELAGEARSANPSSTTLQRRWLGLTAQHGAVESIQVVTETPSENKATATLHLDCAEGETTLRFTVDADGSITGMTTVPSYTAPSYADQSSFTEREFEVTAQDRPLPGTLTIPEGDGPFPGVVLVHGTGAHDRNETTGPNQPFKDLAWGLATRGIAVLRYDKRSYVHEIAAKDWTLDYVTVDDAVAAATQLGNTDVVQSGNVFVVGHSQGGTAAPRIAERHGGLAGIGLLAGFAVSITDLLVAQNRRMLKSVNGSLSESEKEQLDQLEATMQRVQQREFEPDSQIGNLTAAFLYSFLDYDQVATAEGLSLPTFVGQGERDWQVGMRNYEHWMEAFPTESTTGQRYPPLNHFFQPGTGPSLNMEYFYFDNVAESVVTDLASWLNSAV